MGVVFICQLPQNVQDDLRERMTAYLSTLGDEYFEEIGETLESCVEETMNEKLVNILDLNDESADFGLTTEKYGKYIWG